MWDIRGKSLNLPLWQMIGPSIILAGLALGSGEYILWPYITFRSGFVFFWAALLGVGCVAIVIAASAWAATAWQTVVANSRIEFPGSLAGGEFTGRFGKFDAGIVFDPADLAGSRFRVVVETASADTPRSFA